MLPVRASRLPLSSWPHTPQLLKRGSCAPEMAFLKGIYLKDAKLQTAPMSPSTRWHSMQGTAGDSLHRQSEVYKLMAVRGDTPRSVSASLVDSFEQGLLFVHSTPPLNAANQANSLCSNQKDRERPTLKAESTGSGLPRRISYPSSCISERRSSPRGEVLPAHSLSALTPVLSAGTLGTALK